MRVDSKHPLGATYLFQETDACSIPCSLWTLSSMILEKHLFDTSIRGVNRMLIPCRIPGQDTDSSESHEVELSLRIYHFPSTMHVNDVQSVVA